MNYFLIVIETCDLASADQERRNIGSFCICDSPHSTLPVADLIKLLFPIVTKTNKIVNGRIYMEGTTGHTNDLLCIIKFVHIHIHIHVHVHVHVHTSYQMQNICLYINDIGDNGRMIGFLYFPDGLCSRGAGLCWRYSNWNMQCSF